MVIRIVCGGNHFVKRSSTLLAIRTAPEGKSANLHHTTHTGDGKMLCRPSTRARRVLLASTARVRLPRGLHRRSTSSGHDLPPHTDRLRHVAVAVVASHSGGRSSTAFRWPAGTEAGCSADPCTATPCTRVSAAASAHVRVLAGRPGLSSVSARTGLLAWLGSRLKAGAWGAGRAPNNTHSEPTSVEPIPDWAEASAEPVLLTVADWQHNADADVDALLLTLQLDVSPHFGQ